MIQLNLLPDIKADYIKAKGQKRFVVMIAGITIAVCVGIVTVLALIVYGAQGLRLSALKSSIDKKATELKNTNGINEVLTIQNQLNSVDTLHQGKPVTTRLPLYLSQIIPNNVTVSSLSIDLQANTVSISGNTTSLPEVNKLVDTFKFTEIYRGDSQTPSGNAFSKVVLTGFSSDNTTTNYNITFAFDPAIFSSTEKEIRLVVPSTVTTRSTTEQPKDLFEQSSSSSTTTQEAN